MSGTYLMEAARIKEFAVPFEAAKGYRDRTYRNVQEHRNARLAREILATRTFQCLF
jgi:hypothetical protein